MSFIDRAALPFVVKSALIEYKLYSDAGADKRGWEDGRLGGAEYVNYAACGLQVPAGRSMIGTFIRPRLTQVQRSYNLK